MALKNEKFLLLVPDAPKLLALAKGLNLNVAGISISLEHENLYESNIQEAREVFDIAAKFGINLTLLYIGKFNPVGRTQHLQTVKVAGSSQSSTP